MQIELNKMTKNPNVTVFEKKVNMFFEHLLAQNPKIGIFL